MKTHKFSDKSIGGLKTCHISILPLSKMSTWNGLKCKSGRLSSQTDGDLLPLCEHYGVKLVKWSLHHSPWPNIDLDNIFTVVRSICKWIPKFNRKALHHLPVQYPVHKDCTVSLFPVLSAMALLNHEAWYTALDWAPGQVAVNIEYRESSEQRAGCQQERCPDSSPVEMTFF